MLYLNVDFCCIRQILVTYEDDLMVMARLLTGAKKRLQPRTEAGMNRPPSSGNLHAIERLCL
jgi:hypothetical protein